VVAKTKGPELIRLRLLDHPAWAITVNGKPVKTKRTLSYKAVVVPVPAGESRIEARFARTEDRIIGDWAAVLSALTAIFLMSYPRRSLVQAVPPVYQAKTSTEH